MQNKCIRFCLSLGNRHHIGMAEFKKINWLPTRERFIQCVCVSVYRFVNKDAPAYMNDIYKLASSYYHNTRKGVYRLTQPYKTNNSGLNSLSYIGPRQWNDLPNKLKLTTNADTFKHSIKDLFFNNLKKKKMTYIYIINMICHIRFFQTFPTLFVTLYDARAKLKIGIYSLCLYPCHITFGFCVF